MAYAILRRAGMIDNPGNDGRIRRDYRHLQKSICNGILNAKIPVGMLQYSAADSSMGGEWNVSTLKWLEVGRER